MSASGATLTQQPKVNWFKKLINIPRIVKLEAELKNLYEREDSLRKHNREMQQQLNKMHDSFSSQLETLDKLYQSSEHRAEQIIAQTNRQSKSVWKEEDFSRWDEVYISFKLGMVIPYKNIHYPIYYKDFPEHNIPVNDTEYKVIDIENVVGRVVFHLREVQEHE